MLVLSSLQLSKGIFEATYCNEVVRAKLVGYGRIRTWAECLK